MMRPLCLIVCCFALLLASTADAAEPSKMALWTAGQDGYHTYRIPALVVTTKGTLLAFCEGRKTGRGDHGDIDMLLKRSTDGGKTWSDAVVVYEEGGDQKITIGNPCPVVDQSTGVVWLPMCRDNDRVLMTSSKDDGLTWEKPRDITESTKHPAWGWYATGPGNGIQLRSGRLLIPCDHRPKASNSWDRGGRSHAIYSDDHGATWQLGVVTDAGMNECEAVELADGKVLMSMRNYLGPKERCFAISGDGGETWSRSEHHKQVYCPTCQASIERYSLADKNGGKNRIAYAGPGANGRNDLTIRLSYDEGKTWPVSKVLEAGPSAYSALAILPDGDFVIVYESGEKGAYEQLTFARFPLEWIE